MTWSHVNLKGGGGTSFWTHAVGNRIKGSSNGYKEPRYKAALKDGGLD